MAYFYDKSGWYKTPEQEAILPSTAIEIADQRYHELYAAELSGLVVIFKEGLLVAVHPDSLLTPEQLEKRTQDALIYTAKVRLSESDYRVLPDKFVGYSSHNQTAIIDYRAALRRVVNGESNTLPTLVLE